MSIIFHDGGLLTTVQDLGRIGYQAEGMVVAGAMDPYALQIANLLVGNNRIEPALEITMLGPTMETTTNLIIAITGADLGAMIDGTPVPCWQPIAWNRGETLSFDGTSRNGSRAYLAIYGGLRLTPFYQSYATYLMAGIGGFQGRALQKGDQLKVKCTSAHSSLLRRRLPPSLIPIYTKQKTLRVMLGIHQEAFTTKGIHTFLTRSYQITPRFNRMGMRLDGPPIEHISRADIISTTVTFGTVQVPANGLPIILLADRQTTGGYTQIANVISVDLSLLAQSLPGDSLTFEQVSIKTAQQLLKEEQRLFKQLQLHNRMMVN